MKMKKVCEQTGLTDRAVRLYIESGLLSPSEEQGYSGRRSLQFSEADVEMLKTVAVLRKADFSIADIREMKEFPEKIPVITETHKKKLSGEIENKKRILHTLEKYDFSPAFDCFRLAKILDGSASSNVLPKEDSMMRLKDVQRNVRKRIFSVLAFATLVVGCALLLPVFLQAAFADVQLFEKGGFRYEYVFARENFYSGIPLFLAWGSLAAAAVFMLLRVLKRRGLYAVAGVSLCVLSAGILLLLPEEIKSALHRFEFYSYRNSFMWYVLSGTSHSVDLWIQSLKFLPASVSAVLALIDGIWTKETEGL